MENSTYDLRLQITLAPALSVLERLEELTCAVSTSVIHGIFVVVALLGKLVWAILRALRDLGYMLWWLFGLLWLGLRGLVGAFAYTVVIVLGIIWVLVVWIAGQLKVILVVLLRGLRKADRWMGRPAQRLGRWLIVEFGDPIGCFISTYLGVLSFLLLPAPVLEQIVPGALLVTTLISPVAAIPLAALVCSAGTYRRWQRARRGRLGGRVLHAYSDGVLWPLSLARIA